ncbi:MAG TPA: iron ABC transporter permease, partial [Anaerolineaceae bacterium]|nr:iron ABC transporter permease [Anaerolineales bacterium]HIQ08540.1 iron ABC transporter permease [Anaerolineaceae bacterium]
RSDGEIRRALTFLLGGAPLAGWDPVLALLPYWVLGQAGLLTAGHSLNVLQFGEEQALQLGLPVTRAKVLVLLSASLVTAAAVAFAGIIGFVGLIVPHIVRLLWGEDYRHLIPLSLLGGATSLLVMDIVARVLLAPQALPIGIVTALVGTPFFLWVLRRTRRQWLW